MKLMLFLLAVDIRSMYFLGEILFEGTMLTIYDGSHNMCKQNDIKCPVPAECKSETICQIISSL